jgi:hypothetical protein
MMDDGAVALALHAMWLCGCAAAARLRLRIVTATQSAGSQRRNETLIPEPGALQFREF